MSRKWKPRSSIRGRARGIGISPRSAKNTEHGQTINQRPEKPCQPSQRKADVTNLSDPPRQFTCRRYSAGTGCNVLLDDAARLPETYQAAQQALAKCSSLDECQEWADKAEAMASYAKQAKDDSLRKMCDRIQARAIRRCGELLKQIPDNNRGRPAKDIPDGTVTNITRTEAAEQAGLSERQKVTALRVASISDEEFNASVESEEPPTVTQLAERGKKLKSLVDLGDISFSAISGISNPRNRGSASDCWQGHCLLPTSRHRRAIPAAMSSRKS